MKQLCRYVRDHLHVTDLKFTDPFRDATSIVPESDIRSSRKIYGYLNANRSMYKVGRHFTLHTTHTRGNGITDSHFSSL